MLIKNCSNCRHWTEATCRASGPIDSEEGRGIWPVTAPTDWCNRFHVTLPGTIVRKVTDEQVLEIVRVYDRPGDRCAMTMEDLLFALKHEHGLTTTPARRRVEKLVRVGLLGIGDEPPFRKFIEDGSTPFVWLGSGTAPAPERDDRLDEFLTVLRSVAPDERSAKSVRGVMKAIAGWMPLSSTAVHRKLKTLVAAGTVTKTEDGYFAAP